MMSRKSIAVVEPSATGSKRWRRCLAEDYIITTTLTMHHALEIQEILLKILGHYDKSDRPGLVSLAGTCRAFKDPALDVLWEELDDLLPLAQCLPEASHRIQLSSDDDDYTLYSFSRSLTQNEWGILQSYARRIRRIKHFGLPFDEKSIVILSNPPTTEPLFPNLRHLRCSDIVSTPLLHLPFPSLISLELLFDDPHCFQDSLKSFSECSPNITSFSISVGQPDVTFNTLVSNCICRLRNLEEVDCPEISLNMDALAHLSRMPTLTKLSFKQHVTFPDCALSFCNLRYLIFHPASLSPISQLLSWIRLPPIKGFVVSVASCPSRQELSSFLAAVQAADAGHTIEYFCLSSGWDVRSETLLCLADLWRCMAFSNLREIDIRVGWNVGLTDSELLSLASAWPNLERLIINRFWGWNTLGGITPNGLLQLLQKCPSLFQIYLAMDTRGYTELPPADLGLTFRPSFYFDLLDSTIEAESIPAVAAFFASIVSFSSRYTISAWYAIFFVKPPDWEVYDARWQDVQGRVLMLSDAVPE